MTAGGPPPENDRSAGQDGWDFSGTFDGLEGAIKKAGDTIRNSPNPAAEQFILFVGDHGVMGTLGNATPGKGRAAAGGRTEVVRGFIAFARDDPAVEFMEQDLNNVPGFLVFLERAGSLPARQALDNPGAFDFRPGTSSWKSRTVPAGHFA